MGFEHFDFCGQTVGPLTIAIAEQQQMTDLWAAIGEGPAAVAYLPKAPC
jgi:hypothetical protein